MGYIKDRSKSFDSLLFVRALPNEYLVRVGGNKLGVKLGGSALRLFRKHLKVPASAEVTTFNLECSTSNYLGVDVSGYVAWRIDPKNVETAIRSLDFFNRDNPLDKTAGLITDMANDAVRRSIAEIKIDETLKSSDSLKASIEKILENVSKWGLLIDTVGINKIYIKSENVYNELQSEERNKINVVARLSDQETETRVQQGDLEQKKKMQIHESELLEIKIKEETKHKKMEQEAELERIKIAKEMERQKIELSRNIETERFTYEKERLEHDKQLTELKNLIENLTLDIKERKRLVEGGLTDRELAELIADRLETISSIYGNSNLTVFGDKTDAMGTILAPVQALSDLIKGFLGTSKNNDTNESIADEK